MVSWDAFHITPFWAWTLSPTGVFRRLQDSIHQSILKPRIVRGAFSYGAGAGKSVLDCVNRHKRSKFVCLLDVRNFYPSIHFERVRQMMLAVGCSDEAAGVLTRLTTHNYCLEQGYLTSPIIADRVFAQADERIGRLCEGDGLTYTRYVDDIAVSSNFNLKKTTYPEKIKTIIRDCGFEPHPDKEVHGSITGGTPILGLKLNKGRPDVRPEYYDETVLRLKQMASLGNDGEFDGQLFTRDELLGRVNYISWVNRNRRRPLNRLLAAIDWERANQVATQRGIEPRAERFIHERH